MKNLTEENRGFLANFVYRYYSQDNLATALPVYWGIIHSKYRQAIEGYEDVARYVIVEDGFDSTELEAYIKSMLEEGSDFTISEEDVEVFQNYIDGVGYDDAEDIFERIKDYHNAQYGESYIQLFAEALQQEFLPNAMFFTNDEAKAYIENNKHNLGVNPHTYGMSGQDNPTFVKLMKLLVDEVELQEPIIPEDEMAAIFNRMRKDVWDNKGALDRVVDMTKVIDIALGHNYRYEVNDEQLGFFIKDSSPKPMVVTSKYAALVFGVEYTAEHVAHFANNVLLEIQKQKEVTLEISKELKDLIELEFLHLDEWDMNMMYDNAFALSNEEAGLDEFLDKHLEHYALFDTQINGFKAGIASLDKQEVVCMGAERAYTLSQSDNEPCSDDLTDEEILDAYDYEVREVSRKDFLTIVNSDEVGLLTAVKL